MDRIKKLLEEYKTRRPFYIKGCKVVKTICEKIAEDLNYKDALFHFRDKDWDSVILKLKEEKYDSLDTIPDLAGVRVILDNEYQVKEFTKKIFEIFLIIDKHTSFGRLKIDEMGYRSRHFVIKLEERIEKKTGVKVPKEIAGVQVEIQVRTLLQHAWAQLSYCLGLYKEDINSSMLKRRLNIFSANLEASDSLIIELIKLKTQIDDSIKNFDRKKITPQTVQEIISLPIFTEKLNRAYDEFGISMSYDNAPYDETSAREISEILNTFKINNFLFIVNSIIDYWHIVIEALKLPDPHLISDPGILLLLSIAAGIPSQKRSEIIASIPTLNVPQKKELIRRFNALRQPPF